MRIGIVCPYNYFRPGGVQFCIRDIAHYLEERGHYVRVIVPKPRIVPKDIDKNVLLVGGSTEFNTPFATKADLGISTSNEKIDALFAEHKFDVVHFHEPGIPVLSAQLISRSIAANVGTMHATLPEGVVTKSFEKLMIPFAKYLEPKIDIITAVSSVAKTTALLYSPQATIQIVPNGIQLSHYAIKKRRHMGPQKTICFIGRLEKRKGVRYLIDAYAELRKTHHNVRLVIAGDGRLRKSLEARVEKYDIPDVEFRGFISEQEKIDLLQTADLYCSPALYGESFGMVLLEAMAAGCVVVAGNNPGYASVLQERGRLSLVNPLSTIDFSQRLELLLYDQDVRDIWLSWANKYVIQFDYSHVVDAYEAAYRDAIKASAKKRKQTS
ncbi:MAG: glycosyltransferase family 4 protein [Candidatus Saccharibacteria bacterium]|nr:glycosyltransferase family 4 protein [Candidatus Saccharibacteria bacterium]